MPRFFTLLLLFVSFTVWTQNNCNTLLKRKLAERNSGTEHLHLLVKGNTEALKNFKNPSFRFLYSTKDLARISCDINTLVQLTGQKMISWAEIQPTSKRALNDTMLKRNRISAAKAGEAPLSQSYDGDGILLGFIDTGIDFNHPDFKDSLGNTRIRFIWDQVVPAGSSVPQPYNYGQEWTAAQINAGQCLHTDLAYNGHGTHVAGIGAGNGRATSSHYGIASKADIIVVALDFSKAAPTIADAVKYIYDKAQGLGKRCVINISVGDYYGSHDGTDLEAQAIDNLLQNSTGFAVIAAAGNAGNLQIHAHTKPQGDTAFTWVQGINTIRYWCYADSSQVKNLRFSVGANRYNTFYDLGKISYQPFSYGLQNTITDTLFHNGNRIGIIYSSAALNSSGVYERYIDVAADSANLLWRFETAGTGEHHAWNFNFYNSPLPSAVTVPRIAKYQPADSLLTLCSSFQCRWDPLESTCRHASLSIL